MKELPHDINNEAYVLSSILAGEGLAIFKIPDVTPKMFYKTLYGQIFEAMQLLSKRNQAINLISVHNVFKNGEIMPIGMSVDELLIHLEELQDCILSDANIDYFTKILIDHYKRRCNILALDNAMKELSSPLADTEETINELFKNLSKDNVSPEAMINLGDGLSEIIDSIERGDDFYEKKYTTGLKEIDKIVKIKGKKLIVIGARPGHGKTLLAKEIAVSNAKKGLTVLMVNVEMGYKEQIERILSSETNIFYDRFQNNDIKHHFDIKKVVEKATELSNLNIIFTRQFSINVNKIKALAINLNITRGLDMIIVDYLQLLDTDEKKITREQQISEMSRSLKVLANSLDIPIVLLCQLSRECEKRALNDRMPQLSDLRESGAIEQDADIVMFLMCPAKYGIKTINAIPVDDNLLLARVAKNRQGKTADIVKLFLDGSVSTIKNREEEGNES